MSMKPPRSTSAPAIRTWPMKNAIPAEIVTRKPTVVM
jgi:hypothetical protein